MMSAYRLLHAAVAAILSVVILVAVSLSTAQSIEARGSWAAKLDSMISRPQDPVIVSGADLPIFLNTPINELRLYRYAGVGWTAIPFQVDEVDQNGNIVAPGQDDDDNGQALLDANDEVVFMGRDSGRLASCKDSLNMLGGNHERATITVEDSLLGEMGHTYLFRAPSLPISPDSYVSWNESTQTITGTYIYSYTANLGVGQLPFLVDDLYLNSSGDVLDRQKIILQVDFEVDIGFGCGLLAYPISCNFTEEGASDFTCGLVFDSIKSEIGASSAGFVTVGPVRAVSPFGLATNYGSRFDLDFSLFLGVIPVENYCPGTLEVRELRSTLDLNDPAGHGVNTYYDSNGAIATIDGIPDDVDTTPRIDWTQSSGGPAGGLVVAIRELIPGTGSAFTYYLDNRSAGGTGDGASYGETGIQITDSAVEDTLVRLSLTAYVLPPNSKRNVGAKYYEYANTSLTATTAAEFCSELYLPAILVD